MGFPFYSGQFQTFVAIPQFFRDRNTTTSHCKYMLTVSGSICFPRSSDDARSHRGTSCHWISGDLGTTPLLQKKLTDQPWEFIFIPQPLQTKEEATMPRLNCWTYLILFEFFWIATSAQHCYARAHLVSMPVSVCRCLRRRLKLARPSWAFGGKRKKTNEFPALVLIPIEHSSKE